MSRSTAIASALDTPTPQQATAASTLSALLTCGKPGITRLVTITAIAGFALAALDSGAALAAALVIPLIATLVGTILTSGGANALNMWFEAERDARMPRTARRPIPAGLVAPGLVLWAGLGSCLAGVAVLGLFAGPLAALVSLAAIVSYVLVYTPLKILTPWSTLVGAIPGALPPVIGAVAAHAAIEPHASLAVLLSPASVVLFALMLVWQLPHSLALAWMYRDDYAAGGMRLLPVIDRSGRVTAWITLLTSALLACTLLLPVWAMPDLAGAPYAAIAGLSGGAMILASLRLVRRRRDADARAVFIVSILQLPLALVALLAEAVIRAALG